MIEKIEIEYEERKDGNSPWEFTRYISVEKTSGEIIYKNKDSENNYNETKFVLNKGLDKFLHQFQSEDLFEKRLNKRQVPQMESNDNKRFTITVDYGHRKNLIENDYMDKGLPEEYFVFMMAFKQLLASFEGLEILDEKFYNRKEDSPILKNLLELKFNNQIIYVVGDDISIKSGDRVLIDYKPDQIVKDGVYISMKVLRQMLVEVDKLEKDENFKFIGRDISTGLAEDDDKSYYVRRAGGYKNGK